MGCSCSQQEDPKDIHNDKPKDSQFSLPPTSYPKLDDPSVKNPDEAHPNAVENIENPHPDPHNNKKESKTEHIPEVKPAQAGGHTGSLVARGDKLLKKAGNNERVFYESLFSNECTDPALIELRKIVPNFFGVEKIDGKNFLVLENLLTGYENPNLLDCKIGKVTWTREHNERKTADQRNKARTTTTGSLGFRITGLVVKDSSGTVKESIVKDEGFYSINEMNIHQYFEKVVEGDKRQVEEFIAQTERIIRWFKNQSSKVFFTASLFYVNGKNGRSQTRFIDFAYVYDAEGQQDHSNYYLDVIQGLESVVEIWKRLL